MMGWIIVGVAAWLAVAVPVGVLIGRMIRFRDRQMPSAPVQMPSAPVTDPLGRVPAQFTDTAPFDTAPFTDPEKARRARSVGRDRPRRR